MKKITILFALLIALVGCASQKGWKKGQAEWAKIQLNDRLTYDQAFAMALEQVTDKYEMDMISKDGGYFRSAWNFRADKKGKKIKDERFRITVKFNHDRTQLQVKTESQRLKKGDWIDGVDSRLETQIKEDLRGVLGI